LFIICDVSSAHKKCINSDSKRLEKGFEMARLFLFLSDGGEKPFPHYTCSQVQQRPVPTGSLL